MKKVKDNTVKAKKKEKLSDREIREMMGEFRDTYCRKNGAIRRK